VGDTSVRDVMVYGVKVAVLRDGASELERSATALPPATDEIRMRVQSLDRDLLPRGDDGVRVLGGVCWFVVVSF